MVYLRPKASRMSFALGCFRARVNERLRWPGMHRPLFGTIPAASLQRFPSFGLCPMWYGAVLVQALEARLDRKEGYYFGHRSDTPMPRLRS